MSIFAIPLIIDCRDSIAVSIPACHAGDPGSIPGRGAFCFAGGVPAFHFAKACHGSKLAARCARTLYRPMYELLKVLVLLS